jgi:hypothetical protein
MATKTTKSTAEAEVPQLEFELPRPSEENRPRWSDVDSTAIRAFIGAFCDSGHGVLFGTTKDISALTLTMYVHGQKASYVYGQTLAAENALREYTEWAMSYRGRILDDKAVARS